MNTSYSCGILSGGRRIYNAVYEDMEATYTVSLAEGRKRCTFYTLGYNIDKRILAKMSKELRKRIKDGVK